VRGLRRHADGEAEEAEGFLPGVNQPGLRLIQRQSLGLQILFQSLQHRTTAAGPAQQHEVIRITDELCVEFRVIVYPMVQTIEVEIGQQWRQDPALRRAPVIRTIISPAFLLFDDGGFEEEIHQAEDAAVAHAPGHQPEQSRMVDGVEVAA